MRKRSSNRCKGKPCGFDVSWRTNKVEWRINKQDYDLISPTVLTPSPNFKWYPPLPPNLTCSLVQPTLQCNRLVNRGRGVSRHHCHFPFQFSSLQIWRCFKGSNIKNMKQGCLVHYTVHFHIVLSLMKKLIKLCIHWLLFTTSSAIKFRETSSVFRVNWQTFIKFNFLTNVLPTSLSLFV